MNTTSYVLQSATPLLWPAIACAGALIRGRRATGAARLEIWQRWWAVAALGCGSLWMTLSFLTIPSFMADAIGFAHSPFQFEIAFANLALAVLAFRALSASARERMTIGLTAGAFLWGATIGHVYQWFAAGDHAPGNTGGILVYDVLIPAVVVILAWRSRVAQRTVTAQPASPVAAAPTL